MRKMISKGTINLSGSNFNSGETILIDKPIKWTSFKVIHELRKLTGEKKIGHAGTLDPFATGLLIICTGKKTKEISAFQDLEKTYTGTITLGKKTPSMDLETEVIEEKPFEQITEENIYKTRDKFLGKILQIPPMYSAIKYKGKNLYELARKGVTIVRDPREITISKFDIKEIKLPDIKFEIKCSKGTYLRVIADDFGNLLGCGGLLSSLRRTAIGEFTVEISLTIDEFSSICEKQQSLYGL